MRGISSPGDALGQCLIVSDRVARRHGLNLVRATGHTFPGREHWALIRWDDEACEGEVTDLTARQFDASAPATWRGPLEDWLDDVCEWLGDAIFYEVFLHPDDTTSAYSDLWVRDDIDPETARPMSAGVIDLLSRTRLQK